MSILALDNANFFFFFKEYCQNGTFVLRPVFLVVAVVRQLYNCSLPEGAFSASTQAGTQLWLLVLHIQPPKKASKKMSQEQAKKTFAPGSNWKQKR